MWPEEATGRSGPIDERFRLCCKQGKLTVLPELREPPEPLYGLLNHGHPHSSHFLSNIRAYNSIFQMASTTASFDGATLGPGISQFKINGEIHHRIGSLQPEAGMLPKFAQIYILDSERAAERRSQIFDDLELKKPLINQLQRMLQQCNPFVRTFASVASIIREAEEHGQIVPDIVMTISDKGLPRTYRAPTSTEIMGAMPDHDGLTLTRRDVKVYYRVSCEM